MLLRQFALHICFSSSGLPARWDMSFVVGLSAVEDTSTVPLGAEAVVCHPCRAIAAGQIALAWAYTHDHTANSPDCWLPGSLQDPWTLPARRPP